MGRVIINNFVSSLDRSGGRSHLILYNPNCATNASMWYGAGLIYSLKVPKREIFDRSDFPDFYTIKSSWGGDLLVKILTYYFNF
jgi:hypothetical protein